MFKNYLLVALRNLKKQKLFSLINIIGMAVGMAGFAFFAHTAGVKLNSDRFHKNADRIYSVIQVLPIANKDEEHTAYTPAPLLPALRSEFPEIEDGVRIFPAGRMTLKHKNDSFYENGILFVDPNFLMFFTFEMAVGNPETALSEPYSIVMSEAAALKYFGDENPIGKVLTLEKKIDVTVTGVIKNIPRTSSIRFEFLVSMETARALSVGLDDWTIHRQTAFLLLPDRSDKARLEEKLPAFINKYIADSPESPKRMYLFPFLDIRLKSSHITSFMATTFQASVIIVFSIGVLLLLVVCINFINLSTARYMHRMKEIGMRKVIGARRSQLIMQFLGESLLLSFLALPAAVILYELIHPIFSAYIGSPVLGIVTTVSNSIWNYPFLLKYLLIAAVLTGIFSGIYPAFFLSSFQPVQVLKGSLHSGKKKRRGSKIMIVFQFSLSIIFITFAGILKNQFDHLLKADLGYSRDRIAVLEVSGEARSNLKLIKTEISRHPDVISVSASANLPGIWSSKRPARPPGVNEDEALTVEAYGVDYDFIEALDMRIMQGRSFSRDYEDSSNFIINETAAKRFQWENPVGKQLTVGEQTGTVIGVVKDFLFADIGFSLPPAVLYLEPENLNFLLTKFSSSDSFNSIREQLKEQMQIIAPDLPFNCYTLADYFHDMLRVLNSLAWFLNIIGIAAVLFSCLGLLGLASYMVERRTKEIGIRKILGASLTRVIWVLIKEFIILVAVANIIALLLVYFGWNRILQTGLLFMTNISAGTYLFAVFVSLLSAAIAVTSQTLKAARTNPADSLRYE